MRRCLTCRRHPRDWWKPCTFGHMHRFPLSEFEKQQLAKWRRQQRLERENR